MRTIYKYPLKITDRQVLPIKGLMSALHVGLDADQQPCIWCEVEVGESGFAQIETPLTIYIIGTGKPIPVDHVVYFSSFVMGPFVWHIYLLEED